MLQSTLISPSIAYVYLAVFASILVFITAAVARYVGRATVESFLVANRNVPWWIAGPSIAAGWTWAIALMVSVQFAYDTGFAGIFWFTVPNVIAVLIFIWMGPRIRKVLPHGYSLPEWMHHRFENTRVTFLYLFVYFYYQTMACAVQIYAGGSVLSVATGINVFVLMGIVLSITLFYCLFSGLQASLATDFVQLASLLTIGALIVTLVVYASGGSLAFGGVTGVGGLNPFDWRIALTLGVIHSVGLISGSIGEQPFWQRCLAIREGDIRKSFLFGALLFACIPIGLSFLGFAGAGVGLTLPAGLDRSLVGFEVVKLLLPAGIATLFVFLLLAALCSSLDSALVAASSLYKLARTQPWRKDYQHQFSVNEGRLAMVMIGLLGLLISVLVKVVPGFDLKYLWWLLNTIGACVAVPTVLSLFWNRLTAKGILAGSSIGLIVGLPLVVYSSVTGNDYLLAATYAGIIVVTVAACILTATGKPISFQR